MKVSQFAYACRSAFLAVLIGNVQIAIASAQETQPSGREMVDALHAAFGEHHARAVHAKGTIVSGSFLPVTGASKFTIAPHFQKSAGQLTVIGRFSNFTGFPDIADCDPNANPKGFALRFILPDGTATDIVSHSFNGFPASTATEFAVLLRALGASGGKNTARPTPLDQFLESHPVAKYFLTHQKPTPVSWATSPYFGVNTFKFTNAAGESHFVRYQFLPLAEEQYLTAEQMKAADRDYLSQELTQRLKKGPIKFRMVAQVAAAADDIRDPSIAWPATREIVELGTITFSAVVLGEQASKNLQFQPGAVTVGIETADGMLDSRKTAYPVSVSERQ